MVRETKRVSMYGGKINQNWPKVNDNFVNLY